MPADNLSCRDELSQSLPRQPAETAGSFSAEAARGARQAVLAFDLGGTWFRAALVGSEADDIRLLDKTPARNLQNSGGSALRAQKELISYIISKARTYYLRFAITDAAVSIGAAVNMNTGRIVASAPLWGSFTCDLDLARILSSNVPDIKWSILNDVSALAVRLVTVSVPRNPSHAAALTISSGIAYRTIDLRSGNIPADTDYGLQGEIGHLPIETFWRGQRLKEPCDCGAFNHVSSYSSGRAIERLLERLPGMADLPVLSGTVSDWSSNQDARVGHLKRSASVGNSVAMEFLEFITWPLAKVLTYQMTLNPQVGFTVLSGGVPEGLGKPYLDSLVRNLEQIGLYGVPSNDTTYFRRRVGLGNVDGMDALRGAAVFARGVSRRI